MDFRRGMYHTSDLADDRIVHCDIVFSDLCLKHCFINVVSWFAFVVICFVCAVFKLPQML